LNQLNYAIDLYFPPEWVKGSLVLSLFSTLVLIGLFVYLNRYTQRSYFTLWMGAWSFYAVWIVGWLYFLQSPEKENLEWLKLLALGGCAFLLFCGTVRFSGETRGKRELAMFLLLILFGNFLVRDMPTSREWLSIFFFFFLALTSWCTAGYYLRKRIQEKYIGAWLMAIGYLLWGFQMFAYPSLAEDPLYRSTVFVTASAIQLEMAVAMIILVLEETRREAKYLRAQMKTTIRETRSLKRRAQVTEQKYSNLFDHSSDAIFICDPTTLGVEDANQSAEKLTGYPKWELRKLNLMSLCPLLRGKEREVVQDPAKLQALIDSMGNLPIERKDGGVTFVEGAATLVRNNGSSTVELFLREVTELRTLEQKLQQAEKLSALGQLISGVAHELNNPLSVIVGYAQLISQRPHVDEKTRSDLVKVQHESERAARIVRNFLTFARRQPAEKKPLNINDVVKTCLELREYELRVSGVTVHRELGANLPGCYGDAIQLEQVFLNLINNAVHAMEEKEKKELRIKTESDGSCVRIHIIDNGRGIPKELIGRVFDPFFTTKNEGQGTGLGLSISYGIVKNHLGQLTVESQPGGGSDFTVELPAVCRMPTQIHDRDELWEGLKNLKDLPGRHHVLVIDDEVSIQDLFCELLPDDKFYVEGAINGQIAHRLLQHKDFDLIVCDLKMAPMDGRTLFEKISAQKPHLKNRFIFITGDTNCAETLKFLDSTGAAWIAKPFRLAELEDLIAERLLRRHSHA